MHLCTQNASSAKSSEVRVRLFVVVFAEHSCSDRLTEWSVNGARRINKGGRAAREIKLIIISTSTSIRTRINVPTRRLHYLYKCIAEKSENNNNWRSASNSYWCRGCRETYAEKTRSQDQVSACEEVTRWRLCTTLNALNFVSGRGSSAKRRENAPRD